MNNLIRLLCFASIILSLSGCSDNKTKTSNEKVIICGVCKDVGIGIHNTMQSMERLGSRFKDYTIIVYENNSSDGTDKVLKDWAKKNDHVVLISEMLEPHQLPSRREQKIAMGRNRVLALAKDKKYNDYKYLIMADMDFKKPWPVDEIVETTKIPIEWDVIVANGIGRPGDVLTSDIHVDRYAFRDANFPLGDELLGDSWWYELWTPTTRFSFLDREDLVPVFSAFAGLGIFKRDIVTKYTYSGTVTDNLKDYYRTILLSVPRDNFQVKKYLNILGKSENADLSKIPIVFVHNHCCEHVNLYASMSKDGHGKIFVNPKLIMHYD